MPENIATHICEQKVKTAMEAAALADDYALMHERHYGERRARKVFAEATGLCDDYSPAYSGRTEMLDRSTRRADKVCSYCHKKGHLRADCYALRAKSRHPGGQVKGACVAVSVSKVPVLRSEGEGVQQRVLSGGLDAFLPFVSDGFVSLVGSDKKVPVKILRDTAVFDSFIQGSVLPFSKESDTGSSVPVLGVGMKILQVPLHTVMLDSDLVQGQVAVGVRPALPVDGITFILGNGAARSLLARLG